jgi:hypothetical protein
MCQQFDAANIMDQLPKLLLYESKDENDHTVQIHTKYYSNFAIYQKLKFSFAGRVVGQYSNKVEI